MPPAWEAGVAATDCWRFAVSEPHQPHFGTDSERGGPYEQEPLAEEIGNQNKVCRVWYRFYELVPSQDEVGEYEKECSEGEKAASLEHCGQEHHAYQRGVYAYSDADYSLRCRWGYFCEGCCKKGTYTYKQHGKVSLCLSCQFPVMFYFAEVSAGEIDNHPDVGDGEKAHLSQKIVA